MKSIDIIHLPYNGNNIGFLNAIKALTNHHNLYRASELSELWRVIKYGTDRGGFPGEKKWNDSEIKYEDVIYATTEQDIVAAEANSDKSSSFKKFAIIPDPVLLVYDIFGFSNVGDREWCFNNPSQKLQCLKHIVILC